MPQPPAPSSAVSSSAEGQGIVFTDSAKFTEKKETDLEQNIGGKWFARIGIVALVLGVSFFLKYAFDNNWIGVTGRVIIGILGGLTLLAVGEKTIRKYFAYGQIATGGGIAVLYLSIFAAFDYYHLITQFPAFFCMMAVTVIGIILSLRYDAVTLIMTATLGGFLTPFLVSTGINNQFGLFSYILILDLAILAVSFYRKWRWLNLVGFVGTFLVFISWGSEFYSMSQLFSTMFFLTLFFIVYSISSLVYNLIKKEKSSGVEQALTILTATIYFGASYEIMDSRYHAYMGFFAIIMAIYYFLEAYLVSIITAEDKNLYDFLAFLSVGFITLAIPIQFEQNVVTIGWFIEATLLIFLGLRAKKASLSTFGSVIFLLAALKLIIVDAGMRHESTLFIFNEVFFTFFCGIIAAYLLAYLSRDCEEGGANSFIKRGSMIVLFVIVANFLTIFSVSREIVVYYDTKIDDVRSQLDSSRNQQRNYGKNYVDTYRNSPAYIASQSQIAKLKNKSSISLSLFWLSYAIILLMVGIMGKYKIIRIGGILLLILSILKLFFYDLWSLGTLYRIISSISLGIVLLSISFVYQKYKDKIKEII